MTWRLGLIGMALLASTACGETAERLQTIVVVTGPPAVQHALSEVTLDVTSVSDGAKVPTPRPEIGQWPIKLVLAPKNGDANRRFSVEFGARIPGRGGEAFAFSLTTGYAKGSSRYLKVEILDSCVEAEDACRTRECNTALPIDPRELGRSLRDPLLVRIDCKGPPSQVEPDGGMPEAGAGGRVLDPNAGTSAIPTDGGTTVPTPPSAAADGGASDVCSNNPCGAGSCVPSAAQAAGYTCSCPPGQLFDADSCKPVAACTQDNGGCEGECTHDPQGVPSCSCPDPAWLAPDGKSCLSAHEPVKISIGLGSTVRSQPQVAFDESGDGLVVWIHSDGSVSRLWSSRYRVDSNEWSTPAALTQARAAIGEVTLVLDPQGDGVVLWTQRAVETNGASQALEVWRARYSAERFGVPTLLGRGSAGDTFQPMVALNSAGDGVAVWTSANGSRFELWTSRFSAANAQWTNPQLPAAGSEGQHAIGGRVALDDSGRALLVYTQVPVSEMGGLDFWSGAPREKHFPAGGMQVGWSNPIALDEDTAGSPDVALMPDGQGVGVWQRVGEDERSRIVTKNYMPGQGWSADATQLSIEEFGLIPALPRVAVAPQGDAVSLWVQRVNGQFSVWGTVREKMNGEWRAAQELSERTSGPTWMEAPYLRLLEPPFDIALGAEGQGFAVGSTLSSQNARTIWLRRFDSKDGFSDPIELHGDTVSQPSSRVRVARDRAGHGLVVWDQQRAGRYELWSSRID